jgi:hypothetical protein
VERQIEWGEIQTIAKEGDYVYASRLFLFLSGSAFRRPLLAFRSRYYTAKMGRARSERIRFDAAQGFIVGLHFRTETHFLEIRARKIAGLH